jgi:hypothetical protein
MKSTPGTNCNGILVTEEQNLKPVAKDGFFEIDFDKGHTW